AKLGIANLVKEGSKPCEELAQATGMHPQALYRLLRALASVGVFREGADGRFGLTPLAAYLQTGVPDSLRALALMQSEVESQGRVLGVGSLDGHEIKRVYVLPGTQGQGVGRALMRALEAEGQWRGLAELRLEASPSAVRFYEQLGYVRGEQGGFSRGGDEFRCVKMRKAVVPSDEASLRREPEERTHLPHRST